MPQSADRENFEAWFGRPLEQLMVNRDAGFIIAMTAFPLLERYLRRKTSADPNTSLFNRELLSLFPELRDEQAANTFWAIFRHGLLHNVSMSRESHGLSHDKPVIEVAPSGKVWMNPCLFADRVLSLIRADFDTFAQGKPLPVVYPPQPQNISGQPVWYMGTGMPPRGTSK